MSDPDTYYSAGQRAPTVTVTHWAKAPRQAIRKEYTFPINTLQNSKCHGRVATGHKRNNSSLPGPLKSGQVYLHVDWSQE